MLVFTCPDVPKQTQVLRRISTSQYGTFTASSLPLNQANDVRREPTNNGDDEAEFQAHHSALHANDFEQNPTTHQPAFGDGIGSGVCSSDLWSAAYREAVESLGEDLDIAILQGKSVEQLFKDLEEIDKEATHESIFLRGVKYLNSIQIPLETFKLAVDLATPLTSLAPTATTVFGVVRSVTALAISLATADQEFAKKIGEMLEQISYIDDCDTLGQKAGKKDIHKKLLEFYKVAFEILTSKGASLIMRMILENDRLPNAVQEFLRCADTLRKLVQKATWEIVEDIKAMLYDQESSDKMSRQSQYHAYLQDLRADQACDFLLANASFINWYRASDSQQLVILGEMGSGKTVATAFLVDQLSRRNACQLPQPKICYYYCRDDETGQAIHILSALILSLLEQLPGLKKTFFGWYKQAQAAGDFDPATNVKKLEDFLQKVLGTVDRPLFIVIDGLDECDRASLNRLLKLLKTLSQKTRGLKTLLSSRPQEEILEQLQDAAWIDLGSDAKRDGFIVRKTVERQLSYLSEDVKVLVEETLSRLAKGSAIWTKMIVELIEVRRIRALGPMQLFLEEIPLPGQLSKLYGTLISRCTSGDTENLELATAALKLLAISRRPLSILELAWAATLGAAQQEVTTVAALAKLVDSQRVISLIHPFITRINFNDVKKRQVRLTHQSVKEFIIEEWGVNRPGRQGRAMSTETTQARSDQRIENLEAYILQTCIRYLMLDEISNTDLFSEELLAIEELPQEIDLFDDSNDGEPIEYDPSCSWEAWEEDMIRYNPADRGFASIEDLCRAGTTRLDNWIQQNRRPDCVIKPRFEFHTSLYDPLSLTSLYGSEAMLRYMLENSDFGRDRYLPEPGMGAVDQVLQWGDLSRLRILFLEGKLGHQLQNLDFFRLIIKRWSELGMPCDNWDPVFGLVDYVSDTMVREKWGNELLCVAARAGCMPVVRRLMTRAEHDTELRDELLREFQCNEQISFSGKSTHQSIGEAVLGNHVDMVEYLLGQNGIEAHLRHRNSHGENVLHLASRLCNPAMFRLLVPRFQEGVYQTDYQGRYGLNADYRKLFGFTELPDRAEN
ncbi:hypothetical protein DL768_008585 [Monosporascus sp. mg162]|nr:hypothetical protein DL768_008585 [Monosporascus sp. mg162]